MSNEELVIIKTTRHLVIEELFGIVCVCCGSTIDLQLDHIKPQNHRQTNNNTIPYRSITYLKIHKLEYQRLCRKCNSWKGNGPACPCQWWDEKYPGWREINVSNN